MSVVGSISPTMLLFCPRLWYTVCTVIEIWLSPKIIFSFGLEPNKLLPFFYLQRVRVTVLVDLPELFFLYTFVDWGVTQNLFIKQ